MNTTERLEQLRVIAAEALEFNYDSESGKHPAMVTYIWSMRPKIAQALIDVALAEGKVQAYDTEENGEFDFNRLVALKTLAAQAHANLDRVLGGEG